jgi:DNA repair exonuclease SbcCD nuclease subunit
VVVPLPKDNNTYLFVGDPHVTPDALDDCKALVDLIISTALEHKAIVVLLGDQYHTHSVIRLEVLHFWKQFFYELIRNNIPCIALVGNHDMMGNGTSDIYSMIAHDSYCYVVNHQGYDRNGVFFIGYLDDKEWFVNMCKDYNKTKTVVCHQTFTYPNYNETGLGARYENGFFAMDGINPDEIPQDLIISGHIHTPQQFGKVWYVGAPRWRIHTDANTERAIWVMKFDNIGKLLESHRIDTGKVCRKIINLTDTPQCPYDPEMVTDKDDWRVDIKGSPEWCFTREKEWKKMGVKVRTFPEQAYVPKVRESDGIDVAFGKYLDGYAPKFGTDNEAFKKLVKERLNV